MQKEKSKGTQKPSSIFSMPNIAGSEQLLNQKEIEFFIKNGFLVKEAFLDKKRVGSVMDMVWDHLLKTVPMKPGAKRQISREDPTSWFNPEWGEMPSHPTSGPFQGRQPREYYPNGIVKLHDIGSHPLLMDLLPNNPDVRTIASRMLGRDLRESIRTRGIYAVFPRTLHDTGINELGPHTDQVCQQLNVCAYLGDVSERNGGFTIYPGSHKAIFHQHKFQANWSPKETYSDTVRRIAQDIEPWEICAPQGSIIFWHGRLVHTVGIHKNENIRWALFADFTQAHPTLSENDHRKRLQYEWFKDTKMFMEDAPVANNMWECWAIGPE